MPRRGKLRSRGRGNGRRNNNIGGITTVHFHRLTSTTLSGVTGLHTSAINPQNTELGALDDIGNQFDLFKVTSLMYRIHPMNPADTVNQILAYVPDIDTQTVTVAQLSQLPTSTVQTPFCGVPSTWIKVPASQLKGMIDWYKSQADSGAAEFESQGLIVIAGGLSDVCTWEVRGTIKFKNPVTGALMLERTIARLEKLKLVVRIPKEPLAQTPKS